MEVFHCALQRSQLERPDVRALKKREADLEEKVKTACECVDVNRVIVAKD